MVFTDLFAGIPVAHYASMIAWYERLFGRPPDFYPQQQEAVWRVAEHGWIYVVADAARAGRTLLTILVEDVSEQAVWLAAQGFAVGPVEEIPGAARKVALVDPEGNRITFGQPLS